MSTPLKKSSKNSETFPRTPLCCMLIPKRGILPVMYNYEVNYVYNLYYTSTGGVPKPRVSILTYTDIYCNCSKDLMTSGIWMGDLDRTPQIHPNPPQFWAPHGSDGRTCTQAGVPLWHCSCARSWVGTGGPILSHIVPLIWGYYEI